MIEIIKKSIKKTKLLELKIIKLKNKFYLSDYFVITTATSKQHAQSSARKIKECLEKKKISCNIEGFNSDQWILLDTDDCIIHIFINKYREHYNLESLWLI